MTQSHLLELIRTNPGIEQTELRKITGKSAATISAQLIRLLKFRLIRREWGRNTWRLWAT